MKNKLCMFFLILAVGSISSYAQATKDVTKTNDENSKKEDVPPSALSVYEKWKTETMSKLALASDTKHYAITVVAQRIDDQTAQLEYAIAGKMEKYTLEVTPIILTVLADNTLQQKDAGSVIVIKPRLSDEKQSKQQVGTTPSTIRVDKRANAINVTIKMKDGNNDLSYVTTVMLRKSVTVMTNGYFN
jgi:hypothetical protein